MSVSNRFDDFTAYERKVLESALLSEADLNTDEDASFTAWVDAASHLLDELAEATTDAADVTWTPADPTRWERGSADA